MSSSQDNTTSNSLNKESTWHPKNLVNSRWAPGGFEDRTASTDGSAFGAQAFIAACKRARADPAAIIQTGINDMKKDNEANKKAKNLNKDSNSGTLLTKSPRNTTTHESTSSTKITTTQQPHHIISPPSKEEQAARMENPFFDPKKHNGLSSSRWANE